MAGKGKKRLAKGETVDEVLGIADQVHHVNSMVHEADGIAENILATLTGENGSREEPVKTARRERPFLLC